MVWQETVNLSLFGANRFDPYHLHQVLARSYRGYYVGLSIRSREFESPTSRQVLGCLPQFKNFTVNEKKRILLFYALVTELVYVLVLEAKFLEFESPRGHHVYK